MENRISDLEGRNLETTWKWTKKNNLKKEQRKPEWSMELNQRANIRIVSVSEGEELEKGTVYLKKQ